MGELEALLREYDRARGYTDELWRDLTPDEVTQFAALKITPAYIGDFARVGFANLDVDTLVQLKALEVTPEFIRSLEAHGLHPKTADQLVKLKIGLEK